MSDVVKIGIKPAAGGEAQKFVVEVPQSATISELKDEVAKHGTIAAADQRLIYKGQVLKDHKTVSEYGAEVPTVCPCSL